ncbi:contact-dependent growth inhibition system immunity protein [Nocardia sp. NPDC051321]|uniref:contact-dependent growth inhibition system immunity protein n=1 Tax=Nocardia sp. NPDC051321 TaxID=3364323 RepID=UPI00379BD3A7
MDEIGNLSVEQIEETSWPDPPADATRLIKTVHALRRKPIRELTPEDLRVLIRQHEGIQALLPRALDLLTQDPLTEGDYYPGDLLVAILEIPSNNWSKNSPPAASIAEILQKIEHMGDLNQHFAPHEEIWKAINNFRRTTNN